MKLRDMDEYCKLLDTPRKFAKYLKKKAIEAGILKE